MRAGRAGVDRERERAIDESKPLAELVGGAAKQEVGAGALVGAARGAVEPCGEQGAIEEKRGRRSGHAGVIARRTGERKAP